jgi:hypothetical protein
VGFTERGREGKGGALVYRFLAKHYLSSYQKVLLIGAVFMKSFIMYYYVLNRISRKAALLHHNRKTGGSHVSSALLPFPTSNLNLGQQQQRFVFSLPLSLSLSNFSTAKQINKNF